jgi:hypothetical protein
MLFSLRWMRSAGLGALLRALNPRETALEVLKGQQLKNRDPQIVTSMHSPRLPSTFDLSALKRFNLHYSTCYSLVNQSSKFLRLYADRAHALQQLPIPGIILVQHDGDGQQAMAH